MHEEDNVVLETFDDSLAIISLNNPSTNNLLTTKMMENFCHILNKVKNFRVIIIRGNGSSFCEGMDMEENLVQSKLDQNSALYEKMLEEIHRSNAISIAQVHGSVFGTGAGLMAVCDFTIAGNDTVIGFPQVRTGFIPAHAIAILKYKVNVTTIKQLLLRGELISAQKGMSIGLVTYVVENESLIHASLRLVEDILLGGPRCIVQTKNIINQFTTPFLQKEMRIAMDYDEDILSGDEVKEGYQALIENRPPKWFKVIVDEMLTKNNENK